MYDLHSKSSSIVYQGIIDISTTDCIETVSGLYIKNQMTGMYSEVSIDYKNLSRIGSPSSGLVSILISQADAKEYIIHVLLKMMNDNVSCKELCAAFGIIHSHPILENTHLSDSSIENGDTRTSKLERSSPSVLSLTRKFVGSFYGFTEDKNEEKMFVLSQEDMYSLVFSCLSEAQVILILIFRRSLQDWQTMCIFILNHSWIFKKHLLFFFLNF